jgi:hypothetical protein
MLYYYFTHCSDRRSRAFEHRIVILNEVNDPVFSAVTFGANATDHLFFISLEDDTRYAVDKKDLSI